MSLAAVSLVLLAGLAALCGCRDDSEPLRTINTAYGFSIVLPPGWKTFEETTRDCMACLGAENGHGGLVYVCVRHRPPQFATSQDEFLNREQIKSYVEKTLLGRNVECRQTSIQGRRAYETLYLRTVEGPNGGVRVQFVNQTFLIRGNLLYALTTYAMGDTEAEAHARFDSFSEAALRSVMTFFLHDLPAPKH
ncbi:MAG: hypothetical protein GYA47_14785 [Desulfovibrio sp.]|nr:hypothetical protein [Desulfovibrio sp.]